MITTNTKSHAILWIFLTELCVASIGCDRFRSRERRAVDQAISGLEYERARAVPAENPQHDYYLNYRQPAFDRILGMLRKSSPATFREPVLFSAVFFIPENPDDRYFDIDWIEQEFRAAGVCIRNSKGQEIEYRWAPLDKIVEDFLRGNVLRNRVLFVKYGNSSSAVPTSLPSDRETMVLPTEWVDSPLTLQLITQDGGRSAPINVYLFRASGTATQPSETRDPGATP